LTGITMSDSGLPGWASFEQGHALTPLHLNDPNPVTVDNHGAGFRSAAGRHRGCATRCPSLRRDAFL
jgi:hypothetical protein